MLIGLNSRIEDLNVVICRNEGNQAREDHAVLEFTLDCKEAKPIICLIGISLKAKI